MDELNARGELGEVFPRVRKFDACVAKLGEQVELDGVMRVGDTYFVFDRATDGGEYGNDRLSYLKEDASVLPEVASRQYYIFSGLGFDCGIELSQEEHCFTSDDILLEAE